MAKRLAQYDVFDLPLKDIYNDSDFNCRGQFTLESVADLAASIGDKGLDFPVVVQPASDANLTGYAYRLLAGHRRFRAVEFFLKWTTIPAMIRSGLSDYQARLLNLTENLERKDLNMLQEARAIQRIYPAGVSLRQGSQELKRPTKWIAARLRLLTLPEAIQEMAAAGLVTAATIERMGPETTPEEQLLIAEAASKARTLGATNPQMLEKYNQRFKFRRSKEAISRMVLTMFDAGVSGLATRALAWVMREISDTDLLRDIKAEQIKNQTSKKHVSLYGEQDAETTTNT